MRTLIWIALLLFRIFASIKTPCSVKAYGSDPPKCFFEGIAICDTNHLKTILFKYKNKI